MWRACSEDDMKVQYKVNRKKIEKLCYREPIKISIKQFCISKSSRYSFEFVLFTCLIYFLRNLEEFNSLKEHCRKPLKMCPIKLVCVN